MIFPANLLTHTLPTNHLGEVMILSNSCEMLFVLLSEKESKVSNRQHSVLPFSD